MSDLSSPTDDVIAAISDPSGDHEIAHTIRLPGPIARGAVLPPAASP
jgi:hypothetical protein